MIELRSVYADELQTAVEIINCAKQHLKEQGIDQWQNGYPNHDCIKKDILSGKGYFVVDGENILGYLCVDHDGEPAYKDLQGEWHTSENYVGVHRMAFTEKARGKGISSTVFRMVEDMSKAKGITDFRVDTDADNRKMQHILKKNGFAYCGTIWFDNSEKITFDKTF